MVQYGLDILSAELLSEITKQLIAVTGGHFPLEKIKKSLMMDFPKHES